MLEYGIKAITVNPTLITKANEIIRLVDSRTKQTRAFVIPAIYEEYIRKIEKEIEFRKWVDEKKRLIKESKVNNELDEFQKAGIKSITEYLDD